MSKKTIITRILICAVSIYIFLSWFYNGTYLYTDAWIATEHNTFTGTIVANSNGFIKVRSGKTIFWIPESKILLIRAGK